LNLIILEIYIKLNMSEIFITGLRICNGDGFMHLHNIHRSDIINLSNVSRTAGALQYIITVKLNAEYIYRVFIRSNFGHEAKMGMGESSIGKFYRRLQKELYNKNYTEIIIVKGKIDNDYGNPSEIKLRAVSICANEQIFASILKTRISNGLAKWIKDNTIIVKNPNVEAESDEELSD